MARLAACGAQDPTHTARQFGAAPGGGGGGGGGGRGPQTDAPPEEGSMHRATIKGMRPFGVFVELQGYRRWGMVHLSQLSNHMESSRDDSDEQKVEAMKGVVSEGEQVWVKVVEVREDENTGRTRIGCSLKLANQRDGTDLDPHGINYQPRPEGGGGGRAPVGAQAGETAKGKIEWVRAFAPSAPSPSRR